MSSSTYARSILSKPVDMLVTLGGELKFHLRALG